MALIAGAEVAGSGGTTLTRDLLAVGTSDRSYIYIVYYICVKNREKYNYVFNHLLCSLAKSFIYRGDVQVVNTLFFFIRTSKIEVRLPMF